MRCPSCGFDNPDGLKFCGECGASIGSPSRPAPPSTLAAQPQPPSRYTPAYLAEKILTSKTALEGERKQVTVLFADLKGSMELLADRDPEEARQLLDPVVEHMMAAVHRYEGTVNQVMGDGIMALFGAPIAHEDHAVRACYAALAMQASGQQYAAEVQRTRGVPIHIRVGLNAGEVVVRSIGSDLHMDYTAVGQTTHLAARMEQMAMPGSILITADVLRLVGGYVQVTSLGPVAVKGLSAPVEVFELLGAGPVRSRLQAAVARGLTRFVGRQHELETLRHTLEQAGRGQGQVVAVEEAPWQVLDPPQRRRQTLEAVKRLLIRESHVQPLLLTFEDLHWLDSETQALLDSLVESFPTARVLLLVNYRPEYQHGWGSKTYYTQIRLDPLPDARADELLQALVGDDSSVAPLKQLLIARTEGNPFFLEESVRTLVETGGLIGTPGAYRLADQVERLADHAVRGEVWDKALRYCRQAGAKAMERSACREAVGCYEQALAALEHLPEQRDLHEQAIDLWLDLRRAHIVLGQFEHILHDLRAAETLAEALDDPRRLGRVSGYRAQYFLHYGQYDRAIASSQRALALAAAGGDHYTSIEANNFQGLVYFIQRDYRQAMAAFRRAMAALEGEQRDERFGQVEQPAMFSHTYLSLCLAEMGAFAEGMAVGAAGRRIAEAAQHPTSLVSAFQSVGVLDLRQGDLHQALPLLERAVGICEDVDLPFFFSMLASALGAAYVLCGRVDEAVRLLERALEQATSSSTTPIRNAQLFTLGEAHLHAGRLEEAYTLAARALEHARTNQERGNEAYAVRLLGDIATQREPLEPKPAEAYYQQALALAEDLGVRPLAAHCHLGLGTLYLKMGRDDEAHIELSTAIDLYRAMAMTFWMPQAEAALAQVEGR